MTDDDDEEWQVIHNKKSLKVKSYLSSVYCMMMRYTKVGCKIYTKGTKSIKLINQLVWLNYSMYPYLPPKLALSMSIVLICVFLVK
jgi:hypothetical protein